MSFDAPTQPVGIGNDRGRSVILDLGWSRDQTEVGAACAVTDRTGIRLGLCPECLRILRRITGQATPIE